ncbi:hypothetical protein GCM10020254_41810 [Streptomyces goshikiensis]
MYVQPSCTALGCLRSIAPQHLAVRQGDDRPLAPRPPPPPPAPSAASFAIRPSGMTTRTGAGATAFAFTFGRDFSPPSIHDVTPPFGWSTTRSPSLRPYATPPPRLTSVSSFVDPANMSASKRFGPVLYTLATAPSASLTTTGAPGATAAPADESANADPTGTARTAAAPHHNGGGTEGRAAGVRRVLRMVGGSPRSRSSLRDGDAASTKLRVRYLRIPSAM